MGFDDLLGNQRLKENLISSLSRGRISHFYLISGPEGSGRHTLARLLASAILCQGEDKPCLRCSHCRKVLADTHPDTRKHGTLAAFKSISVAGSRLVVILAVCEHKIDVAVSVKVILEDTLEHALFRYEQILPAVFEGAASEGFKALGYYLFCHKFVPPVSYAYEKRVRFYYSRIFTLCQ